MTEDEAKQELADATLVPAVQGAMDYVREVAQKCLDADIPVRLERCRGKT